MSAKRLNFLLYFKESARKKSRDQLTARHKANHIQVMYAPSAETADQAFAAKAAMLAEMDIIVRMCGDVRVGYVLHTM